MRLSVFNMFVQEVCEWVRGVRLVHTCHSVQVHVRGQPQWVLLAFQLVLRQGLLLLLGIPVSVSDLAMGALELETYLEPSPQASL